jgi:hypothetical protein
MADNPTLLLAVWSTILSTALACLKIWEVSRDRLRLTATYVFSVRPEDGNEVIIQNVSKTPALITYWELMWAHRRLGRTVFERMAGYPTNEGYCHITVTAHSRHVLDFKGKEHFETHGEIEGHKVSLYLRTYLVRRSPVWLLVWKPRR